MRFTTPTGNPTSVLDRAEGRTYILTKAVDAAALCELLNTMQDRIISLGISADSEPDFSGGKVLTAGREGDEQI